MSEVSVPREGFEHTRINYLQSRQRKRLEGSMPKELQIVLGVPKREILWCPALDLYKTKKRQLTSEVSGAQYRDTEHKGQRQSLESEIARLKLKIAILAQGPLFLFQAV